MEDHPSLANRDVDQFPRNFLEKLKEGSLEEEEEEEEGREMERGIAALIS